MVTLHMLSSVLDELVLICFFSLPSHSFCGSFLTNLTLHILFIHPLQLSFIGETPELHHQVISFSSDCGYGVGYWHRCCIASSLTADCMIRNDIVPLIQ
jgi:hypothetical protein